ncbi:hypothetical protein ACFYQA_38575 [Streptomyces sp. NPDC005774]|uniref:hypothetical protein n=1 Tax=Streptomyces sp. NPDC005774 TaxID=3364728 RepID=UPI0036C42E85
MSTRRPLGTGPTSTTRSTPTSPRLLPVERGERDELVDVEHQDVAARKGRRILGAGHETGLEAQQVIPLDGPPGGRTAAP